MDKYKFSKYNKIFHIGNKVYIYNSISGGLGEIEPRYENIFDRSLSENEIIKMISDENALMDQLKDGMMVIENDLNELTYLRFLHNQMRYANCNSFGITIIPTNSCNCRCPYCFEKYADYPEGNMSDKVQSKIIDYLDNRLSFNGKLNISWFGGEPLLAINTMKEMMKKICKLKSDKELDVYQFIVTNGILMNEDNVKALIDMGITSAQVTLDGPRKIHDKKRALKNNKGTFDIILRNLMNCDERINISLRVNIDKENANEIQNLLDELRAVGLHNKKNISIYYSMIRDYSTESKDINKNCYATQDYAEIENEIHIISEKSGFPVRLEPVSNIGNCGAISPNSIVVEADGTMQKCWNAVGDQAKSVGNILDKYSTINSNLIKWLGWDALDNNQCVECEELPICYGGCPYQSIYGTKINSNYKCSSIAYNALERLQGFTLRT